MNEEIKNAIDSFDIERARTLLREALKNPDAETYYLASQVALNDEQKTEFLTKALNLDPAHRNARLALDKLSPSQSAAPSPDALTQALARQRSFVFPAIITFILTFFFWIPGLIANIFFLREARRAKRMAGETLPGTGLLWILLVINGIIPVVILIVIGSTILSNSQQAQAPQSTLDTTWSWVFKNETYCKITVTPDTTLIPKFADSVVIKDYWTTYFKYWHPIDLAPNASVSLPEDTLEAVTSHLSVSMPLKFTESVPLGESADPDCSWLPKSTYVNPPSNDQRHIITIVKAVDISNSPDTNPSN
ncbi:MAG: hypothetical protein KF716_32410 [Anaerolineae bacterium]|nr:hypothetical protein [Anaerolineae bacterium]